ncbi:hypothetical protein C922_04042 [Plasmodium inui San Antonio 1]|uniref:RRM domain-containing protein n=1 Tax=Plasmodium inui San Antonio 1 TaxID=1237626 RepID=W7AJN8_9APIC|nr:hypothetical protein C922_04042 [Plasmodium inui San Antonio 1]EUD65536.1 hypothetical protein C922_04042 [Plasmodium inui San Antonio 1]
MGKDSTDEAHLVKGAQHDSSKERGRDHDSRTSRSKAKLAEVERPKEEEKEKKKGRKEKDKQEKEDRVDHASKRKHTEGERTKMKKAVSTSEQRDAPKEGRRSPNAGDEHTAKISKSTMKDRQLDDDATNSSSKEVDEDQHSLILQREEETFLAERKMKTGSFKSSDKNEMGKRELNEHSNHSDDASNINKGKSEIDSRIKRKMHSLKQNEEKKKKKTDADNAPSIASDSSDEADVASKEKSSHNSTTALFDRNSRDDGREKRRYGSQENHAIFADEALKGYPRIFVTRLPFEAGKKDLEKYFSKYGTIVDIYVSKNLSNNKNKGFGFVSFEKQSSMDKVLTDKLHIICGKEIVVDVASLRDNRSRHLFHLPSDHYLAKYPKNDRNSPTRAHNNLVDFNNYQYMYNRTANIGDMSKNIDNNLVMQNFYNLCPTYNILGNRMNNNKHIYKNNMSMSFLPPTGYNMDPAYFNNQQMPYQNCLDYMGNEYYWNMANYYNWNNMMLHNENMYNANAKQMEYPYYLCNGQYMNQNALPPIAKGKSPRKSSASEESISKYPQSVVPSGSYRPSGHPFVRKLPGGDEWNKRGYKLFVTKLNSVTTTESLRNYFETFGEIIDIYMPNDVCTNRPRGIAFVTFLDNECVKKILSNKNSKHIIDGKEVVVDLADPETKTKKNLYYP